MTETMAPVIGLGSGSAGEDRGLHHWDVPGVGAGERMRIVARAGRSTTVVGANGAGKSALGTWMEQDSGNFSLMRRIIAHRKLWFTSAGPEITAAQRESTRTNMSQWSRQNDRDT